VAIQRIADPTAEEIRHPNVRHCKTGSADGTHRSDSLILVFSPARRRSC